MMHLGVCNAYTFEAKQKALDLLTMHISSIKFSCMDIMLVKLEPPKEQR